MYKRYVTRLLIADYRLSLWLPCRNKWNVFNIVNAGGRSWVDLGRPSRIPQRPLCAALCLPRFRFQCLLWRKQTLGIDFSGAVKWPKRTPVALRWEAILGQEATFERAKIVGDSTLALRLRFLCKIEISKFLH
jgi:hypothetical protein